VLVINSPQRGELPMGYLYKVREKLEGILDVQVLIIIGHVDFKVIHKILPNRENEKNIF